MDATDLKALLVKHGFRPDDGISTHLLHACATTRLPLSYALALVEKESGFLNIYGRDPVRNPIKSPAHGVRRVTYTSYCAYRAYRRAGWGCQGVGPTQLTYYAFQDEADRIGGCHKPYSNMVVGFSLLKAKINALGKQRGAAAYNGAGEAADRYGRDFVSKQLAWHELIT